MPVFNDRRVAHVPQKRIDLHRTRLDDDVENFVVASVVRDLKILDSTLSFEFPTNTSEMKELVKKVQQDEHGDINIVYVFRYSFRGDIEGESYIAAMCVDKDGCTYVEPRGIASKSQKNFKKIHREIDRSLGESVVLPPWRKKVWMPLESIHLTITQLNKRLSRIDALHNHKHVHVSQDIETTRFVRVDNFIETERKKKKKRKRRKKSCIASAHENELPSRSLSLEGFFENTVENLDSWKEDTIVCAIDPGVEMPIACSVLIDVNAPDSVESWVDPKEEWLRFWGENRKRGLTENMYAHVTGLLWYNQVEEKSMKCHPLILKALEHRSKNPLIVQDFSKIESALRVHIQCHSVMLDYYTSRSFAVRRALRFRMKRSGQDKLASKLVDAVRSTFRSANRIAQDVPITKRVVFAFGAETPKKSYRGHIGTSGAGAFRRALCRTQQYVAGLSSNTSVVDIPEPYTSKRCPTCKIVRHVQASKDNKNEKESRDVYMFQLKCNTGRLNELENDECYYERSVSRCIHCHIYKTRTSKKKKFFHRDFAATVRFSFACVRSSFVRVLFHAFFFEIHEQVNIGRVLVEVFETKTVTRPRYLRWPSEITTDEMDVAETLVEMVDDD